MRTEPRSFKFKSRHLPEARPEWEERKRRVEEDVFGASQTPRVRFGLARRQVVEAARPGGPLRFGQPHGCPAAAGVALVLVYLTYRAILWIESQDYGGFLQFMKANG